MCLLLTSRRSGRRWMQNRGTLAPPLQRRLAQGLLPASLISVLVWANEALVLWLLVLLLALASITIPAAITIYLLSGTAGMASTLPGDRCE